MNAIATLEKNEEPTILTVKELCDVFNSLPLLERADLSGYIRGRRDSFKENKQKEAV